MGWSLGRFAWKIVNGEIIFQCDSYFLVILLDFVHLFPFICKSIHFVHGNLIGVQ